MVLVNNFGTKQANHKCARCGNVDVRIKDDGLCYLCSKAAELAGVEAEHDNLILRNGLNLKDAERLFELKRKIPSLVGEINEYKKTVPAQWKK